MLINIYDCFTHLMQVVQNIYACHVPPHFTQIMHRWEEKVPDRSSNLGSRVFRRAADFTGLARGVCISRKYKI